MRYHDFNLKNFWLLIYFLSPQIALVKHRVKLRKKCFISPLFSPFALSLSTGEKRSKGGDGKSEVMASGERSEEREAKKRGRHEERAREIKREGQRRDSP